jgi:hypothetical protein
VTYGDSHTPTNQQLRATGRGHTRHSARADTDLRGYPDARARAGDRRDAGRVATGEGREEGKTRARCAYVSETDVVAKTILMWTTIKP